jgi:hypothetical protein
LDASALPMSVAFWWFPASCSDWECFTWLGWIRVLLRLNAQAVLRYVLCRSFLFSNVGIHDVWYTKA